MENPDPNHINPHLIPWRKAVIGDQMKDALIKLVLVRKAHIAPHGQTNTVWQAVVDDLFRNPLFAGYQKVKVGNFRKVYETILKDVGEKMGILGLDGTM
jgi:hypothetical protein